MKKEMEEIPDELNPDLMLNTIASELLIKIEMCIRDRSHRADIPCIQTVYGRLPAFGNTGECRDIHPALYTGIRITG